MILKYALRELKKDIIGNIPVIVQMTAALIMIAASVSSVTSRFKYYQPYSELMQRNGNIAVITSASDISSEYMKNLLDDCEDIYMTYSMSAGTDIRSPIVYDDYLMTCYQPEILSGSWVISDPQKSIPQVMVSEGYGYSTGDIISTNNGTELEVAGTFNSTEKLLLFNNMAANFSDYRLLFSESDESYMTVVLSRSEANKINARCFPYGIAFICLEENADDTVIGDDLRILSAYGMVGSFKNDIVNANSRSYIYDQLYTLLPVMVCIIMLLIISIICVSSISISKRLKYYAVYQICGSSVKQCECMVAVKSIMIYAISAALSIILIAIKDRAGLFENVIIEMGFLQILFCILFLIIDIIVSLAVFKIIEGKKSLNQIFRSN